MFALRQRTIDDQCLHSKVFEKNRWTDNLLTPDEIGANSPLAKKDKEVLLMLRHISLFENKIEEQNKRLEALYAEVRARCDENNGLPIPHFWQVRTFDKSVLIDLSTQMT